MNAAPAPDLEAGLGDVSSQKGGIVDPPVAEHDVAIRERLGRLQKAHRDTDLTMDAIGVGDDDKQAPVSCQPVRSSLQQNHRSLHVLQQARDHDRVERNPRLELLGQAEVKVQGVAQLATQVRDVFRAAVDV